MLWHSRWTWTALSTVCTHSRWTLSHTYEQRLSCSKFYPPVFAWFACTAEQQRNRRRIHLLCVEHAKVGKVKPLGGWRSGTEQAHLHHWSQYLTKLIYRSPALSVFELEVPDRSGYSHCSCHMMQKKRVRSSESMNIIHESTYAYNFFRTVGRFCLRLIAATCKYSNTKVASPAAGQKCRK